MTDTRFAPVVALACHDLRTPLATVTGFAQTLTRLGELDPRSARFVELIEGAAVQLAGLVDELAVLARIEAGRYEPALAPADTLDLATSPDERVVTEGAGETITTAEETVRHSLEALAVAAARHGDLDTVRWTVAGRELELAPVTAAAAPIVTGEEVRDLGAIVARRVIEELGGAVELEGETLRVKL
jgi:signal transduction histidine kinase